MPQYLPLHQPSQPARITDICVWQVQVNLGTRHPILHTNAALPKQWVATTLPSRRCAERSEAFLCVQVQNVDSNLIYYKFIKASTM